MTHQSIRDDRRYPANLRGRDDQPLSTGEAQFRTSEYRGWFWPQEGAYIASGLGPVTTVEIIDGQRVSVSKWEACPDPWPPHYHFEYEAGG